MIGKYEMRVKINQFCGNISSIFQEEIAMKMEKMEINKIPIKICIIILKRVIRILQMINLKIALNSIVFTD